jgi:hypothetical protein
MSSFAFVLASITTIATSDASLITSPRVRVHYDAPDVELWISGDNLFRRGDRARVYFRTDEDAFVTIVRIDTDGRVDVLFPEDPYGDAEVRGGHTYRVYGHGHESFVINDYPGLGYIFAIASWEPFDYERVSHGRRWDYRYAGGRVHRDPYVAAREFAELLLEDPRASYSFDVAEYHVERRVSYPRFLCYDCHAYRPYPVWNPYSHACLKFRIVIWDDPYYYPYRYYGGRRVVYVRERVREPRYEFKEIPRGSRPSDATMIEYRRRPTTVDRRRPGSPTEDPNITGRRRIDDVPSTGGSGATRPGDDIRDERVTSGRRRATELDRDAGAEPRSPIRPPRRDTPTYDEREVEGRDRVIRPPRRDDPEVELERDERADDRVIIEDRGRREPRVDDWRSEPRRDEPRREPPRSEPRSEPRAEPRSEPRRESPRVEPRRESPRAEPRRESPRSEPKSRPPSTPSNSRARRT